ncbi:RNA helicase [Prochlorococcus sp. MIT 1341]|uniref:RNA helicase n=1 Tax=Prochlorococcus sp. MIT 1341 TaxID=3096221 RepID=UPI002A74E440|nr:RNA helicase [Prochlorococcus sp. MIT 1341]
MNRNSHPRQRSRDPLDRRVDQWLETGRQFVDGVAGTKPGQRKYGRSERRSESNLTTVGRWVGNKLDWFLEEEEDWLEELGVNNQNEASKTKRPLDAISRRMTPMLPPRPQQKDDWPNENIFKVNRWERNESLRDQAQTPKNKNHVQTHEKRSLPKSNRRRR